MGYLYLIKNSVNSKVYVGITTRTLAIRWTEHLLKAHKGKEKLYKAMRKYGVAQFECFSIFSI